MHTACWRRLAVMALAMLALMAGFGTWLLAANGTRPIWVDGTKVSGELKGGVRTITYADATVTSDDAVFSAKQIVQRIQDKVHQFTCTGDPKYTDQENVIVGQQVVATSSPRGAEFIGNVKLVNTPKPKGADNATDHGPTTITSEKLKFDYGTKFASFVGNVKMLTSPGTAKPAEGTKGEFSKEPSIITSDRMDYDSRAKKAHAVGNVQVVQKERTVWADDAVYEEDADLILLTGNVRMQNTGKEEIKEVKDAESVTISTSESEYISILPKPGGKVRMRFEIPEEDESPAAPAKK